jgi:hypothetical protein
MKIKSFAYDYLIQRDLIHYKTRNFTLKPNMIKNLQKVYGKIERGIEYEFPFEILAIGRKEHYKRSDVYNVAMDYATITKNMKYFRNNPIVFVDNEICFNYRMKVHSDRVIFYFKAEDLHEIAMRHNPDSPIDAIATDIKVVFVPNATIDMADNLIPGMVASKNIDARNFDHDNFLIFNQTKKYIAFWIDKETGNHFMDPYVTWNAESKYFTLSDYPPTDVTKFKLVVVGTNAYKQFVDINPESSQYYQFTTEQMPIPKSNLMVFIKKDDLDVFYPNDGSITIDEYYPNIYKINNPNSKFLRIIVLSDERSHNDHIWYDNEIKPYMKRNDLLSKYRSDTVPELIKEFNPIKWVYSIYDYLLSTADEHLSRTVVSDIEGINPTDVAVAEFENDNVFHDLIAEVRSSGVVGFRPDATSDDEYMPLYIDINTEQGVKELQELFVDIMGGVEPPSEPDGDYSINTLFHLEEKGGWKPFLYKMDTISNTLKQWFYFYEEYVRRTYGFLSGWYHNIANYDNMEEKIRTDTSQETDSPILQYTFDEPQYVFSYKNTSLYGTVKSYIFYIDGKYAIPTKIMVDKGYQYVYFPVSRIKENSIIEVERFDGLVLNKPYELPEGGITIDFGTISKVNTIANCLFLVDDETKEYLSKDDVDVFVIDPDVGRIYIDLATSVYEIGTNMQLVLIPSEAYVGKTVRLCCNNRTFQFFAHEDGKDFEKGYQDIINLNDKGFITSVNKSVMPRLRIYTQDGRLIPKRSYDVFKHDKYTDKPRFQIPIWTDKSLTFMVAYTGYDERLIYHREKIPANGFISFEGRTSRPFSFKYHDIYLDGYRLTKYDVEIISPYAIVITSMEKFDTDTTVEIYEKKHVNDRFVKFDYNEKSEYIMDKILQKEQAFREYLERTLPTYEPTGDTEHVDAITDEWYDFWRYYLPFRFINGNKRYDLEAYHHCFAEGSNDRILLNADDRVRYKGLVYAIYYLSHDLEIEEGNKEVPYHEEDENMLVVDESIEVDEDVYKYDGYKVDDYNPVYEDPYEAIEKDDSEPTETDPDASRSDGRYMPDNEFPHQTFDQRYTHGN